MKNYQSNFERKISDSLLIRQLKPTLNANKNQLSYVFLIGLSQKLSSEWLYFIDLFKIVFKHSFYDSCFLCIVFNTEIGKLIGKLIDCLL